MGEQPMSAATSQASAARASSWRDVVAAQYEFQQARLRVAIEDDGGTEEHL
ncbi:hypothetical protein [Georgenia satyanarayanai]|uniref:hypothetical protein n=1 Tax=Georgenia satyanarayanai TaxID=860221 RepID=UPI00186B569F|nr:hypothetical protein [Georgenia satyanarayanai]